jgi:hypothetical protein
MNWGKHIKKFEKYEDLDNEDDFDFSDELSPKTYGKYEEDEDNDEELKAAFQNLSNNIKNMITNAGFKNFTVSVHDKDFVIEFIFEQNKKFSSFASLISLMKKIHKDILVTYEPAIDLWHTKDGRPLITFDFYYKEGGSKKNYDWTDDLPF